LPGQNDTKTEKVLGSSDSDECEGQTSAALWLVIAFNIFP
jgi:hypothetical protein